LDFQELVHQLLTSLINTHHDEVNNIYHRNEVCDISEAELVRGAGVACSQINQGQTQQSLAGACSASNSVAKNGIQKGGHQADGPKMLQTAW
jgi:hypothetical protein